MNRTGYRVVIVLLLAAPAAAAVGVAAYNAGVAQGLAEASRAAGTANVPAPYIYAWPRPWGFGLFPFFPFFPFLFIFLWFVLLRGLWWRGSRGWGWQDGGVPPRFEEWHRRAHEREANRNSELRTQN